MYNYKITVAYDGTRYKGWQSQRSTDATIQAKLEGVLKRTFGYPIEVVGSGRTDAGVHAKGQIANFHLYEAVDEDELMGIFNTYLPEDIAVCALEEAPERFHSRFMASEKTYRYRIHTSNVPEASYLIGTKDFTSFCGNSHMKKSAVRTIYDIRFEKLPEEIRIDFRGNGFLQHMVRIMTGTLIEVGQGKKKAEDMPGILAAKNRALAGFTAPPQGLMLMQVKYKLGDCDV